MATLLSRLVPGSWSNAKDETSMMDAGRSPVNGVTNTINHDADVAVSLNTSPPDLSGLNSNARSQKSNNAAQGRGEDGESTEEDSDFDSSSGKRPHKQMARDAQNHKRRRTDQTSTVRVGDRDHSSGSSNEGSDTTGEHDSELEDNWAVDDDESVEHDPADEMTQLCVFCGEDEEHDPSDEYEEPLTCRRCSRMAHRQCASEEDSLELEEGSTSWRCPNCLQHSVGSDEESLSGSSRRRSSAPKITRDLLPASKLSKPGSHSVFSTLILDDDPMDGSRPLRKRKASSASEEKSEENWKKPKRSMSVNKRRNSIESILQSANSHPATLISEAAGQALNSSRVRPARARLPKSTNRPLVTRLPPFTDDNYTLAIRMAPSRLAAFETERRKQKRREEKARKNDALQRAFDQMPEVSHYPALQAPNFLFQPFASNDKETDESKTKPYGGILSEAEADTSRTFPQAADRQKFEDARLKAEEQWRKKIELARASDLNRPTQKSTGPPSKIKCINFGGFEIDTWHAAPYPEEYSRNRVLYICEFCMKYMNSDFVAWRHKLKCPARHPPGDEIYRDGSISFFEVDGRKNPVYCQNLCLLAKLFLGSKTLYYDVEPFLFYIMTENDDFGCHFVGYFSKEKRPSSMNNVSCILVLPIHQRRGFGHLLIDFSYLLTRVEKKTGSPEKPLSDMGLVSYRTYWRLILCYQLRDQTSPLSLTDLSARTGMMADDIVSALEGLRALVRDPITKQYALRLDLDFYKSYVDNYESKGYLKLNPDALVWVPYVMGRDNQHYESGAPLHTVAQRDEDKGDAQPEEGVQMLEAEGEASSKATEEYATATASTGVITPDIDSGKESGDGLIPFPSLNHDLQSYTPSVGSRRGRNTPSLKSNNQEAASVPPTRFEVFPPLPGTAVRKKLGRPPRRGTPMRRAYDLSNQRMSTGDAPALTVRRARSNLVEEDAADSMDIENDEDEQPSPPLEAGLEAAPAEFENHVQHE